MDEFQNTDYKKERENGIRNVLQNGTAVKKFVDNYIESNRKSTTCEFCKNNIKITFPKETSYDTVIFLQNLLKVDTLDQSATFIMSFTESPASKAAEVDALRVECAPYPLIPDLINTDLIHLAIVL